MTVASEIWRRERARVASLTRSREPNDPELIAARRVMRAHRAEDRISAIVAEAALSPEQVDRLTALLRQGVAR